MKWITYVLLLFPLLLQPMQAGAAGESMKRVTIGVAGMMKSKTGIT
jgi:hypothetical protein